MLSEFSTPETKQLLQKDLYPIIKDWYPDIAEKVTAMLLKGDDSELMYMLGHQDIMRSKVEEIVAIVKGSCNEKVHETNATLQPELPAQRENVETPPLPTTTTVEKQILSKRLYSVICHWHPNLATRVVENMIKMNNSELLYMLEHHDALKVKVTEEIAKLQDQHNINQKPLAAIMSSPIQMTMKTDVKQSKNLHNQTPQMTLDLAKFSITEENQKIGEHLFSIIKDWCPNSAGKVTEILLQGDISELLYMLGHHGALRVKVKEVVAIVEGTYIENKKHPITNIRYLPNEVVTGRNIMVAPSPKPQIASMLAGFNVTEENQRLGAHLFSIIKNWYPDSAGRITEILLQGDNSELLYMLGYHEALRAKVEEIAILESKCSKDQHRLTTNIRNSAQMSVLKREITHSHEPQRAPVLTQFKTARDNQSLGTHIFSMIKDWCQDSAKVVTEILLQGDNSELHYLLRNHSALKTKVKTIAAAVECHRVKKQKEMFSNMRILKKQESIPKMSMAYQEETLSASKLAECSTVERNAVLGKHLFQTIQNWYPNSAGKITEILLGLNNTELLYLLGCHRELRVKVQNIVSFMDENRAQKRVLPNVRNFAGQVPVQKKGETIRSQEALGALNFSEFNVTDQKKMLNMYLLTVVRGWYPNLAESITAMLFQLNWSELLYMFQHPEVLRAKAEEAAAIVEGDLTKKQKLTLSNMRYSTQQVSASQKSVTTHDQELLKPSMLVNLNSVQQKQILGEHIFPIVYSWYPDSAGRIMENLLKINNVELLNMYRNHDALRAKVEVAVAIMEACDAKKVNVIKKT